MAKPGTVAPPPNTTPWCLRPETLVGAGPFMEWCYGQVFATQDQNVSTFCCDCASEATHLQDHHPILWDRCLPKVLLLGPDDAHKEC